MPQGYSISALYRQWLNDGLHEILQSTGQGALLEWNTASEVIKEALWEMEGVLRSSGYQGADNLLFYALFQRLCSQKFGANGVFTLEAYPTDQQQETLLKDALDERPGMINGPVPASGWRGFDLFDWQYAPRDLLVPEPPENPIPVERKGGGLCVAFTGL
jgi:hypothetical protein